MVQSKFVLGMTVAILLMTGFCMGAFTRDLFVTNFEQICRWSGGDYDGSVKLK